MKVLVIGGTPNVPTQKERDYYQKYIEFFTRSAHASSNEASVYATMMDDLLIEVGDGALRIYDAYNHMELTEYGAFFIRGDKLRVYMDIIATINEYARVHDITMINDYSNVKDSSKLLQAARFQALGVPVARTLNVNSALLNNLNLVEGWSLPCVMKAKHGSHGNDNYVVQTPAEIEFILKKSPDKHFVLQRFIPNDGDYRILIVGDETMVIGRSAQAGTHLNNTSKGGVASHVDTQSLPLRVIEQSKEIARYFGLTIAGVDALQDKETGEFYFLEVNAQPQLMSGAFIDKKEKIVGALLDSLARQR